MPTLSIIFFIWATKMPQWHIFTNHCSFHLLIPNCSATTGLRPSISPSLTRISTATGCRHSFAQPLTLRRARATLMKTRSLQTTLDMCWPSTATRSTFASSDPSSQGTIPATPHRRRHFPLTARDHPAPGPGPGLAPTLDPGPTPEKMVLAPREAPAGPRA